jgi:hypothetical protein
MTFKNSENEFRYRRTFQSLQPQPDHGRLRCTGNRQFRMKIRIERHNHSVVNTRPFNDVPVFSLRHPNFTGVVAIKPCCPEQEGGVSWHSLIEEESN